MNTEKTPGRVEGLVSPTSMFDFHVNADHAGARADIFLSKQFSHYSRSFFQRLIDSGCVTVNNALLRKHGISLKSGDHVCVIFPEQKGVDTQMIIAKSAHVVCIHKDEHFLVISKPADLVIHKPKENYPEATLVDWLTLNFDDIASVGYVDRPGIVHRLDKDTSGLMLVARTNYGHQMLSALFKERAIHKTYLALVEGHPPREGSIDFPIGRHPVTRTKMMAAKQHTVGSGDITMRDALTRYEVIHYFDTCSLVKARPVTGRTHQIRVHFAALGYPLLGDLLYGSTSGYIARQALHAHELSFTYNGQPYSFKLNPPHDFQQAVVQLNAQGDGTLPEAVKTLISRA